MARPLLPAGLPPFCSGSEAASGRRRHVSRAALSSGRGRCAAGGSAVAVHLPLSWLEEANVPRSLELPRGMAES